MPETLSGSSPWEIQLLKPSSTLDRASQLSVQDRLVVLQLSRQHLLSQPYTLQRVFDPVTCSHQWLLTLER